jgi:hypothetical protein
MALPYVKDNIEIEFRDREAIKDACKSIGISFQKFCAAYVMAVIAKAAKVSGKEYKITKRWTTKRCIITLTDKNAITFKKLRQK